jgi:hypothetical protein
MNQFSIQTYFVEEFIGIIDFLENFTKDTNIIFFKPMDGKINYDDYRDPKAMEIYKYLPGFYANIILYSSAFNRFKFSTPMNVYNICLDIDLLAKYMIHRPKDKNDRLDTLNIQINADDDKHIVFNEITKVNRECGHVSEVGYKLPLLELKMNEDKTNIFVDMKYDMCVEVDCKVFRQAYHYLVKFSDYVEMICDESELVLECVTHNVIHREKFKASDKTLIKKISENQVSQIRCTIDLKKINYLYNCTERASRLQIYLKENNSMVLKYSVGVFADIIVGFLSVEK